MKLPKYTDNSKKERIGVNKTASILSEMGLIFRETSNSDIGIDGQVEEVDEEFNATGRIMAIQIKSGKSYLKDNINEWKYTVDEAHKNYWRLFPIPVMLLVHNTNDGMIYFIDAKFALNSTGEIVIPKQNVLCIEKKDEFLKTLGGCTKFSDIEDVFIMMQNEKWTEASATFSFLELFIIGLTNLCSDIFYDVTIAFKIIRSKNKDHILSIGEGYHDFLWRYVSFLVKENLAEINYHACLFDYDFRSIQPRFIAPLTYRGKELLKYITSLEQQFLEESNVQLISESIVEIEFDNYSALRLERLTELQSLLLAKMGQ